jgi:L-cysteine desulfidase
LGGEGYSSLTAAAVLGKMGKNAEAALPVLKETLGKQTNEAVQTEIKKAIDKIEKSEDTSEEAKTYQTNLQKIT